MSERDETDEQNEQEVEQEPEQEDVEDDYVHVFALGQFTSGENFTQINTDARPDVGAWGDDILDLIESIADEYVPEGLNDDDDITAFESNVTAVMNSLAAACQKRGLLPDDDEPAQRWPKNKKVW